MSNPLGSPSGDQDPFQVRNASDVMYAILKYGGGLALLLAAISAMAVCGR